MRHCLVLSALALGIAPVGPLSAMSCSATFEITGVGTTSACTGQIDRLTYLENGNVAIGFTSPVSSPPNCTISSIEQVTLGVFLLQPSHPSFKRIVDGAHVAKIVGSSFSVFVKAGVGNVCEIVRADED